MITMILKKSLKVVPIFGWCMQCMMYIFLERKREDDLPKMKHVISYLLTMNRSKSNIFIFPEGTDLSISNITKSNNFAKEKSLKELKYVLYPKCTGLI